jgi:hypothetical protein
LSAATVSSGVVWCSDWLTVQGFESLCAATAGAREPDLAGYAKATVWFAYTYSSDPDARGNHLFTVRRYQFNGTKLASSSEKTYRKPFSFKSAIGSVMK